MNIKNNQQYLNTHLRIENYVLSVLRERKLQEITVTEVCRNLSINRSTFYAHFIDIMDVLEQMEASHMEEIQTLFTQGLQISKKEGFLAVFRFIADHKDFYSIYLGQNKEIDFSDNMLFDRQEAAEQITRGQLSFTDEEIDYFLSFFRSGINSLIRKWLSEGMEISPEELFAILRKQFAIYRLMS